MSAPSELKRIVHRHIWKRIPRSVRRRALISASTALAPAPDQDALACEPYIVAGFLTAASGLGASARLCADALRQAGRTVLGIDLSQRFRQNDAAIDFAIEDGRRHEGPGTLIVHVNAPFLPLALWAIGRRVLRKKHVAAYWAWELPSVPREWRAGVPRAHTIIVPSRFTAEAIAPIAPHNPPRVLGHPVALRSQVTAHRPGDDDTFTALCVFNMASGYSRKNPTAALTAFGNAFGDDANVRLVVKTLNADTYPAGAAELRERAAKSKNIVVDERNLAEGELATLYASADAILSLHRSEGFGLAIAEGMLAGKPVIATDWSGNTDFLNVSNGFPVGYKMIDSFDPQGEYDQPGVQWADPDVDEAAHHLLRLRGDRSLREAIGVAARADALRLFAGDTYVDGLETALGAGRIEALP